MYIVAKSVKKKTKNYVQGNGKDKGKGEPKVLQEEIVEGIDYQTIQVFYTEEEAYEEAEKRVKGNPFNEYLVFIAGRRYKTKEPAIVTEELI
jgi:hypothetical protein